MEVIALLSLLIMVQLSNLCSPVAAAAMSRPTSSRLERRLESVCGGDSSLQQCGAPFPSDFCCPQSAVCLQLESTAMAVLCCPAGQDCKFVSPISCDRTAQNATLLPRNQLHSDPTTQLDQCGDSCCPPGATCHSGLCAIQAAATTSSITTTPISSLLSTSSMSASTTSDIATQSSPFATASTSPNTLDDIDITDTAKRLADEFSGKSFVAGLFPGIVIGAIAVALLMWCLNRRRRLYRNRNHHADYNEKKHFSAADQLTSLTPDPYRRPTHMRSISEPVADPANGHRTDFVRGTPSPPRVVDPLNLNSNASYTATATGPITPAPTPKIRALFSRSTVFQSPPTPPTNNFPSHLKRGTLTHAYTISPIRALRSKKSSHSLRREMTADAAAAPQPLNTRGARHHPPQHRTRPHLPPTTNSTETIKVLMSRIELQGCSPDQRKQQRPNQHQNQHRRLPSEPTSSKPPILPQHNLQPTPSWATTSSSPHYPAPIRSQPSFDYDKTPTRVPASQARFADRALGMPFSSPSSQQQQGGLSVASKNEREDDDTRRQTTFSGFMERAGIRTGGA
jgi:hypothetical protein